MPEEKLIRVPLEQLEPAPENPRKTHDESGIAELADSIAVQGLLQNLVAYEEGGKYLVVAGGRRLAALRLLESQDRLPQDLKEIPVLLTSKDAGLELAIIENLQREDPPPLEEAVAYAQLLERGLDPAEIAKRVGKSEKLVRDRIALARKLGDTGKQLLANGKISLNTAYLLARLPLEEQEPAAGKFLLDPDGAMAYLKGLFTSNTFPKSRAIFPLDDYTREGGEVLEGLFGEGEPLLLNRPLAMRLQEEAAKKMADNFAKQGPAELVIGSFDVSSYRQAREGETGTTYVVFDPETGTVTVHVNMTEAGNQNSPASDPVPAIAPTVSPGPAPNTVAGNPTATVRREEPSAPKPSQRIKDEWEALKVGAAARYLHQGSTRLAKALAIYAAVNPTAGYYLSAIKNRIGEWFYPKREERDLQREKGLRERLKQLVGSSPSLPELIAMNDEDLDEAFRLIMALAMHRAPSFPNVDFTEMLTVGDLDADFVKGLPKQVIVEALEECEISHKKTAKKNSLAALLLERTSCPVPAAIVSFIEKEGKR